MPLFGGDANLDVGKMFFFFWGGEGGEGKESGTSTIE